MRIGNVGSSAFLGTFGVPADAPRKGASAGGAGDRQLKPLCASCLVSRAARPNTADALSEADGRMSALQGFGDRPGLAEMEWTPPSLRGSGHDWRASGTERHQCAKVELQHNHLKERRNGMSASHP